MAEYWIDDPDSRTVEVYALDGETYWVAGILVEDETVGVGCFVGGAIPVHAIFERS